MQLTFSAWNGIVDSGPNEISASSWKPDKNLEFGRPAPGVIDERPCSSGNGRTEGPALLFSGENRRRFFVSQLASLRDVFYVRSESMKAMLVTSFTGPDGLQLQEVPDPATHPGQVIVNVEAVGLNFADVLGAMGKYPGGPEPPYICGREFAGTVEGTGERVMGYTQYGACAEKIAMNRNLLFPAPPQWRPELCAAFPVNFLTAWLAYWEAGLLRANPNDPSPIGNHAKKRVLIHAAAGGVGTAAIQIGNLLGIETFGTASTDEKLEAARQLGLTHGINYSREDYEVRVKELTDGEGVDAVLDSLAGEHTGKSLRCCGFLGRVILFGSASGERPKFDVMAMYNKSASVHGLWLSKLASNTALINSALESMRPWIAEGKLKPLIGAEFPLEKAAEAFRMMRERRSHGKVVLRVT